MCISVITKDQPRNRKRDCERSCKVRSWQGDVRLDTAALSTGHPRISLRPLELTCLPTPILALFAYIFTLLLELLYMLVACSCGTVKADSEQFPPRAYVETAESVGVCSTTHYTSHCLYTTRPWTVAWMFAPAC